MKQNDKIDIMKVIIAPKYKLNMKNGYVDINNPYIHSNKWVAIYPVEGANFKSFYPDSGEVCYNSFANVAEVQLVSGVHGVKFVVGSAV